MLYTYQKNKKTEHIIYFWLGHTSSADEIGKHWRAGSFRIECSDLTVARHALREYIISYHSVYDTLYPDLIRLFCAYFFPFLSFLLSFCLLSNTSRNFIGSAALLASEMDKSLGGRPVQVCLCVYASSIHVCVLLSDQLTVLVWTELQLSRVLQLLAAYLTEFSDDDGDYWCVWIWLVLLSLAELSSRLSLSFHPRSVSLKARSPFTSLNSSRAKL